MFNNERINNLEEQLDNIDDILEYNRNRIDSVVKRIIDIEEELETIEPDNRWRKDNKYLSSYCPKCKANNRSQIPARSKRSMQFTCGECNTIYRVYFDREDIEEGGE